MRTDPTVNEDQREIWYDGVDQNCDERLRQDFDGYDVFEYGGVDCDDLDKQRINWIPMQVSLAMVVEQC